MANRYTLIILLILFSPIAKSNYELGLGERYLLQKIRTQSLKDQLNKISSTPTDINIGLAERASLKTPTGNITLTKNLPMTITKPALAAQGLKLANTLTKLSVPSILASAVIEKVLQSNPNVKTCTTQSQVGWLPSASLLPSFIADLCNESQQTITPDNYTISSESVCGVSCPSASGTTVSIAAVRQGCCTQYKTSCTSQQLWGPNQFCSYSAGTQGNLALVYNTGTGPNVNVTVPLTPLSQPVTSTVQTPISQIENDQALTNAINQLTPDQIWDKAVQDFITSKQPLSDNTSPIPLDTPISSGTETSTQPPFTTQPETKLNPDGSTSSVTHTITPTTKATTTGTNFGNQVTNWEADYNIVTNTTNNTTNVTTTTNTTVNEKEKEQQKSDLCETYPDILACSKLGEIPQPQEDTIPTLNLFNYTPPSDTPGTCPAPLTTTLTSGQVISMSYEYPCQMASTLRPMVLIIAIIGSMYILIGHKKES